MDTVTTSRKLLDAIGAFADAYGGDRRFGDLVASLREAHGSVERLVPGVREQPEQPDEPESPGKRAAREAATEAAEKATAPTSRD